MFEPTLESSKKYARENKLEEWLHQFLCIEGKHNEMSDAWKRKKMEYFGPILMSFNLIRRCYGPEPEMEARIPEDDEEQLKWFWKNIDDIAERFKTGNWDMPPLIALDKLESGGVYGLDDGNHRFEALKKLGVKEYWVIFTKVFE